MRRLLLFGAALALVCTACGGSARPAASVPVGSVHTIATARRHAAARRAERLLRRVVLPAGAVRVRRPPGHAGEVMLRSQLGVSTLTKFADRHAFWSVRLPLSTVDAFVKAHPVAGLKWSGSGSSGGAGSPNVLEEFYGGRAGDRPVQRLLTVVMARERGRTFIRIDAGHAWVYPRSPREVVPSGVREIDVQGNSVSRRVTAPRQVARIVRWFDALNVVQPGQPVVGCRLSLASKVKFSFRSAGGAELASAIVPSQPADGCYPISFAIRGQQQTPLIDSTPGRGKAFIDRVQRLLGVRFRSRR